MPFLAAQLGFAATPPAAGGYIQSIQQVSITIAAAATSNTATISAVNTANTMVIYQGLNTDNTLTTVYESVLTRVVLTNGTTVTATRGGIAGAVTVNAVVVEWASQVISIQAGTISLTTAQTSNTATISAVGATAFVLFLGSSCSTAASTYTHASPAVALTNSTTVTATLGLTGSAIVASYMVVELTSTLIKSAQSVSTTSTSSASDITSSSYSAITRSNSVIMHNGQTSTSDTTSGIISHAIDIDGAVSDTACALARQNNASTLSRTIKMSVVEFQNGILKSNQNASSTNMGSNNPLDVTITSINTAKTFDVFDGMRAVGNPNTAFVRCSLLDSSTVRLAVNTAGTSGPATRVLEFN